MTAVVFGYFFMNNATLSIFSSASRCTVFWLISNWMSRMLQYCCVFATIGTTTSTGAAAATYTGGGGRAPRHIHRRRRFGRFRRGFFGHTERVDQADQRHVDVTLVTHRIVDAVALPLAPQREGTREVVLHAEAVLIAAFGLARVGVGHSDSAREAVLGLVVGQAYAPERRELLRERQDADCVKVEALEFRRPVQRSTTGRGRIEAELAEVEVAGFQREVFVELPSAEDFVADVFVVLVDRGVSSQLAVQPVAVNIPLRHAESDAAVPAVFRCCGQRDVHHGDSREAQRPQGFS